MFISLYQFIFVLNNITTFGHENLIKMFNEFNRKIGKSQLQYNLYC